MKPALHPAVLLLALLPALPLAGQEAAAPVPLQAPVGAGGEAYRRAVSGAGAQTGGSWFDPDAPAPAEDEQAEEPAPGQAEERYAEMPPAVRWSLVAAAAAVILAVLGLTVFYGGGRVAARRPGQAAPAPGASAAPEAVGPGPSASLAQILALADRREALARLFALALGHAAAAEGLRIGRGQTARDVLRSLPPGHDTTRELATLMRVQESVRFGGREVSAELLEACAARTRLILGPAAEGRA
ncbi:DUF4129 domain-containing protein [Oceanicella sp. SM1341]|uniref:DUF4129 domain-containing protein n=1 Tax=Oceanicella sp. SM1341 TaxID=1548889 RepID=UPI0013006D67|nr:DUF4129 domain-containing protein [Oceanicella sp. SM1341]